MLEVWKGVVTSGECTMMLDGWEVQTRVIRMA